MNICGLITCDILIVLPPPMFYSWVAVCFYCLYCVMITGMGIHRNLRIDSALLYMRTQSVSGYGKSEGYESFQEGDPAMEQNEMRKILERVRDGALSPDEAMLKIREAPYTDLGYAMIDNHRQVRQGFAEVIYGAGKTKEQILGITRNMSDSGVKTILVTRLTGEKAAFLEQELPGFQYFEMARMGVAGEMPAPSGRGTIVVASGGTSDLPVSEEAAVTAMALGNRVVRLVDVGVSGLHRLLAHMDEIMSATVIIAVAGMEGALASVIAGLADCPVIAVPTSVGYGANFGGLSALLSMLNSCASGVSVVNIDNGFGAGYQAAMINRRMQTDN